MELIFEVIFQFVGEILLQLTVQVLSEMGLRSLASSFTRPRNRVFSTIGFILWGALFGGFSLLVYPTAAIHDPQLRVVNLAVTPVAVGGAMALLGKFRDRKGQDLVALDEFFYAFLFAFCMTLVRLIWAA